MGMFDHILEESRKLSHGTSLPIQIRIDDNGCIDRCCPSSECETVFKVQYSDWTEKIRQEVAFCPICGYQADATEWNTPYQVEYIKQLALAFIQKRLGDAFKRDAEAFNRSQTRSDFISLSMSYKPGTTQLTVPCEAAEAMRQKFECESCGCHYSAIGAAFFCPACGHNSASSTFGMAIMTVRTTVANIPTIRHALQADPDGAENTSRLILEQAFDKLVSSYQRFAEAMFSQIAADLQIKVRKNAFQNIQEGSELCYKAIGNSYEDMIPGADLRDLRRYFQQRHLLAHKEGMVDQEYIDKSGDTAIRTGQKLVIKEEDVLRLAELVEQLSVAFRKSVDA